MKGAGSDYQSTGVAFIDSPLTVMGKTSTVKILKLLPAWSPFFPNIGPPVHQTYAWSLSLY